MFVTRIKLKNWRNFQAIDIPLREVSYLLGPNASGKSNLLDALRFLRDISKPQGGGLQAAVSVRGGMGKIRSLHAPRDGEVNIEIELASAIDTATEWRYILGFKSEGKDGQRVLISDEQVWRGHTRIFSRPDRNDQSDPILLTQTGLEQIATNGQFRELSEFFGSITYLHLVPQLLKFAQQIAGQNIEHDPFGQGFLERMAQTPERTRTARLRKISLALKWAVPQFEELRFTKDASGRPHLEALYAHHRAYAGWQSEEHFSDGTLRLIGLLWSLLDGTSLQLLEEPEISLNDAIVREIPLLLHRLQQGRRDKRQIILSTHSEALLSNPGIDGRGVVLLESGLQGTTARSLNQDEIQVIEAGLSVAEVALPKTRPSTADQLGLRL